MNGSVTAQIPPPRPPPPQFSRRQSLQNDEYKYDQRKRDSLNIEPLKMFV